jgi:predicted RNase H-like HicB family nuclease
MKTEILFVVESAEEGGYCARAVGQSIFTEADTLDELRANIREAVDCHFEPDNAPKLIRLHIVHDEVMAV